jgi:superfamily II DNA or RNA helicase
MQTARPYQCDAVEAVFGEWSKGVRRTLGVAPTGSGKTNIACDVIRRMLPKRTIFLAHRVELVQQAVDRLASFKIEADVEQGFRTTLDTSLFGRKPVLVATPQTLFASGDKRLKKLNPDDFGCLIIDEVHHYVAEAFMRPLLHLCQNESLKVMGLTATADRADGKALSQIMDSVAFNIEICSLIDDGWLVPIEQQLVKIEGLDFSKCRVTKAGDLNDRDLEEVMREEKTMLGVADASLKTIGEKRAIVFCVSVKQAERLAEIFNRYRANSADWVYASTPENLRKEKLAKFANGKTQIMTNVGVLTEGYDNPEIAVVVQARPTMSRSLYAQMIGRGMRALTGVLHEGLTDKEARRLAIAQSSKSKLVVLDFASNSLRHRLITTADILGGKISEEAKERTIAKIKESGQPVNITEAMLEEEARVRREIEEAKKRAASQRAHLTADATFTATYVDPFDEIHRTAQYWQRHVQTAPLTAKQRQIVIDAGENPDKHTPEENGEIIRKHFAATEPQIRVLVRAGYPEKKARMLRKWEAGKIITELAKNGWKRPVAGKPDIKSSPEPNGKTKEVIEEFPHFEDCLPLPPK